MWDRDSAWLETKKISQKECWPYKIYNCISELDHALYNSPRRKPEMRNYTTLMGKVPGSKPGGPTLFLFRVYFILSYFS